MAPLKPELSRMPQGLLESGSAEEVQRAADLLRDYQGALAHESQALGAALAALRVLLVNQVRTHVVLAGEPSPEWTAARAAAPSLHCWLVRLTDSMPAVGCRLRLAPVPALVPACSGAGSAGADAFWPTLNPNHAVQTCVWSVAGGSGTAGDGAGGAGFEAAAGVPHAPGGADRRPAAPRLQVVIQWCSESDGRVWSCQQCGLGPLHLRCLLAESTQHAAA